MTPAKKTTEEKEEKAEKKPAAKKAAPRKKAPAKEAVVAEEASSTEEAAPAAEPKLTKDGYVYALGRRKRAIAQTRLWPSGTGDIKVNGKAFKSYFTVYSQQEAVLAPLKAAGQDDKVTITLEVYGGGMRGQSEAARHGISRALVLLNPTFRGSLKKLGFMTRDPREKERKKYGLKKARKGPQWAKR